MRDITIHKPPPRVQVKAQARKQVEAHRREVYRLVNIRDEFRCRACGIRCCRTMACLPERLEHHHLNFRSLGGKHETANIVTLCLRDHVEAQQHRLIITGNPDEDLTFTRVP